MESPPRQSTPPESYHDTVDEMEPVRTPPADEEVVRVFSTISPAPHHRFASEESLFELLNIHNLSPLLFPDVSGGGHEGDHSTGSIVDRDRDLQARSGVVADSPTPKNRISALPLIFTPANNSAGPNRIPTTNVASTASSATTSNGQEMPKNAKKRQTKRSADTVPRAPADILVQRNKSQSFSTLGISQRTSVDNLDTKNRPPLSPIPDASEAALDPAATDFRPLLSVPLNGAAPFEEIVVKGKNEIGDLTKNARAVLLKRGLKPIPALHGPLNLPYARCPSGIDAFLFAPEKDLDPWSFVMEAPDDRRAPLNRRVVSVPLPGNARYAQQQAHTKSNKGPVITDSLGVKRFVSAPPFERRRNEQWQFDRDPAPHVSLSTFDSHRQAPPATYYPISDLMTASTSFNGDRAPAFHDSQRQTQSTVDEQTLESVKAAAFAAGFGQGMGEMLEQQQQFSSYPTSFAPAPWPTPNYPFYAPSLYHQAAPQVYSNQFAEAPYNLDPIYDAYPKSEHMSFVDPAIITMGSLPLNHPQAAYHAVEGQEEEEEESESEDEHDRGQAAPDDGFYFPMLAHSQHAADSRSAAAAAYAQATTSTSPIRRVQSVATLPRTPRGTSMPLAPVPAVASHIASLSPERRYSAAPAILHGPRKTSNIVLPASSSYATRSRRLSVATTEMRRGLNVLEEMSQQHQRDKERECAQMTVVLLQIQTQHTEATERSQLRSMAVRMPRAPPMSPLPTMSYPATQRREGASLTHNKSSPAIGGSIVSDVDWSVNSNGNANVTVNTAPSASAAAASSTHAHRSSWRARSKPRHEN